MSDDTTELSEQVSLRIKDLCSNGYQRYDAGEFESALRAFYQAWMLLPKPQTQYSQAGWVLTALCDTYFRLGKYPQALEAVNSALYCPHAEKNMFALLRKGQILLDMGELASARIALYKVYASAAQSLLTAEDPRYQLAIQDLVN